MSKARISRKSNERLGICIGRGGELYNLITLP